MKKKVEEKANQRILFSIKDQRFNIKIFGKEINFFGKKFTEDVFEAEILEKFEDRVKIKALNIPIDFPAQWRTIDKDIIIREYLPGAKK